MNIFELQLYAEYFKYKIGGRIFARRQSLVRLYLHIDKTLVCLVILSSPFKKQGNSVGVKKSSTSFFIYIFPSPRFVANLIL